MRKTLNKEDIRNWIIELDEQYERESIPLSERPLKTFVEISYRIFEFKKEHSIDNNILLESRECVVLNLSSVEHEMVHAWYVQKYGESAFILEEEKMPYLVGNEIWPMTFHCLYMEPPRVPMDCIFGNIPGDVKKKITDEFEKYVYFWSDAIDFAYRCRTATKQMTVQEAACMLTSGIRYFRNASTGLFEVPFNTSIPQNAILSIEMMFKAYFLESKILTEEILKKKFGHKIISLLAEYIRINPTSELVRVQNSLHMFPNVNARYTLGNRPNAETWEIYRITTFIVASILRNLTSQSCRDGVEKEFPAFKCKEF